MKKSIVILLVISSIFVVSCAPQVTVTSEVTVTSLPPTATQTPEPSATPTAVYTPTPDQETITNARGIGFVLGEQVVGQPDGVKIVTDIVPSDYMDAKEKDLFEIMTNPEKIGFAKGETQMVYVPTEDGKFRIELQRTSNPTDVIAVFGTDKFVWDWEKLVNEDGEHVLFKGAMDSDKKDMNTTFHAVGNTVTPTMEEMGLLKPGVNHVDSKVIYSKDGMSIVIVDFLQRGENPNQGYVFTRAKDGKTIVLWVENFDLSLPFVTK